MEIGLGLPSSAKKWWVDSMNLPAGDPPVGLYDYHRGRLSFILLIEPGGAFHLRNTNKYDGSWEGGKGVVTAISHSAGAGNSFRFTFHLTGNFIAGVPTGGLDPAFTGLVPSASLPQGLVSSESGAPVVGRAITRHELHGAKYDASFTWPRPPHTPYYDAHPEAVLTDAFASFAEAGKSMLDDDAEFGSLATAFRSNEDEFPFTPVYMVGDGDEEDDDEDDNDADANDNDDDDEEDE